MSHTLTLPWINTATKHFVFAGQMREVLSLALASQQNVIFSGPGGHAKSELLGAVFGAIKGINPFVKSLGQGTTTEELLGGIDFDALNRSTGACIQYNPELSFLPHEVAVFEELFDAPGRVLNMLKDVLTAKKLRNGAQTYDMRTSIICAATNHSPADIAAAGPDVEALIQRFALQLEVKWQSYTSDDYLQMFLTADGAEPETDLVSWEDIIRLQEQTTKVTIYKPVLQVLAKVIEELRGLNVNISPRTAMKALTLIRAAAAINGRNKAVPEDIKVIGYLPGCAGHDKKIIELIEDYAAEYCREDVLQVAEQRFAEIRQLIEQSAIGTRWFDTRWLALRQEVTVLQRQLQNNDFDTDAEVTRRVELFEESKALYDELSLLKNGRPRTQIIEQPVQPVQPVAPVQPATQVIPQLTEPAAVSAMDKLDLLKARFNTNGK